MAAYPTNFDVNALPRFIYLSAPIAAGSSHAMLECLFNRPLHSVYWDHDARRRSLVMGHTAIQHKLKHQEELRSITAKLIRIEKLEVRDA